MGALRLVAAGVLLLGAAAHSSAQEMQIQLAEPVQIAARPGHSEFDAYGRRFALELEGNEGAIANLPVVRKAELSQVRLLRGKLAGNPASWIRLTTFAGRVEGAIWDGSDLYTVTTHDRIARHLTNPLAATPGQTVVFRLSDTLNALPRAFCAVTASAEGLAPNNGLVQYRKLVAELAIKSGAMAVLMTRQMEISLIADATFQNSYGANASAEMLARFNVAEGIFGEQAALLLRPTDVRLAPAAPDPFTATNASALLNQVSTFRRNTDAVSDRGVAHLVTGRDLDGDTAGIAILGGACDLEDGVSLSEGWLSVTMSALVMAHELGHNFGAEHDGVSGACASAPQTFIMAPALNGSAQFSQCSLTAMRAIIDTAACMTPAVYAHVELVPGAPVVTAYNEDPLVLTFVVRSTGTLAAQSVRLNLTPQGSLPAISVSPTGACTITGGEASCDLGDMPAGAERQVDVTVLPSVIGVSHVVAEATAANNQNTRDSSETRRVEVQRNLDGEVTMVALPATALSGDSVDFNVTVRSLRSRALLNARVNVGTGGMTFESVTGAASCALSDQSVVCSLGDIPGGQQRQFTVRARTSGTGDRVVNAYLYTDNEVTDANNYASANVHLDPRRDVSLEAIDANKLSAFNEPFEFNANVRAHGIEPTANVTLTINVSRPTSANTGIDSVTIGGVACLPAQPSRYECALGTLAAGEIRRVVITGRGVALGTYAFDLRTSASQQDNPNNDNLVRGVTVMHPVDVEVFSPPLISGTESIEFLGSLMVGSNGMLAVPSSQITMTFPTAVRFTRFFSAHPCTQLDPQRLQCTVSFAQPGQRADISWFAISDTPGAYNATVTAVTPNDAVQSNDSRQVPFNIAALVDVGTEQFSVPEYLLFGRDYDIPVNIRAGSRDVSSATVRIIALGSAVVRSVSIAGNSCVREDAQRLQCTLAAIPAGSTVPLVATIAANEDFGSGLLSVDAFAANDNNQSNNIKNANFQIFAAGDLQLSVAAGTATGTAGATMAYPRISIRHAGPIAGGRFEVSLPAFAALNQVSGSAAICSGTTLVQCTLPSSWPENQALEFDLVLAANAAGTFNSTVRVISGNDSNAANDQASVSITVNAAGPPPVVPPPVNPPSGGGASGGGGGGRIEWLLLALLGGIASRRVIRTRCAA